jgi:hypothetical protein
MAQTNSAARSNKRGLGAAMMRSSLGVRRAAGIYEILNLNTEYYDREIAPRALLETFSDRDF